MSESNEDNDTKPFIELWLLVGSKIYNCNRQKKSFVNSVHKDHMIYDEQLRDGQSLCLCICTKSDAKVTQIWYECTCVNFITWSSALREYALPDMIYE